jgi:hypothetical protein
MNRLCYTHQTRAVVSAGPKLAGGVSNSINPYPLPITPPHSVSWKDRVLFCVTHSFPFGYHIKHKSDFLQIFLYYHLSRRLHSFIHDSSTALIYTAVVAYIIS